LPLTKRFFSPDNIKALICRIHLRNNRMKKNPDNSAKIYDLLENLIFFNFLLSSQGLAGFMALILRLVDERIPFKNISLLSVILYS